MDIILAEFRLYLQVAGFLESTQNSYISDVKNYFNFCDQFSCEYSSSQSVFRYLSYLSFHKAKSSTISRKRASLVSFSDWYEEFNGKPIFIKKKIKTPKQESILPTSYTFQEIQNLLHQFNLEEKWELRDNCILTFLFGTGVRASELLNIKIGDIKKDGRIIILGKGQKYRTVFLGKQMMQIFQKYLGVFKNSILQYKTLFFNQKMEPLSYQGLYHIITKLNKSKTQLKVYKHLHPHAFRHSFATSLLENGGDIRKIAELMGHKSLDTTQKYTHINKKLMRETMLSHHPHFKSI